MGICLSITYNSLARNRRKYLEFNNFFSQNRRQDIVKKNILLEIVDKFLVRRCRTFQSGILL